MRFVQRCQFSNPVVAVIMGSSSAGGDETRRRMLGARRACERHVMSAPYPRGGRFASGTERATSGHHCRRRRLASGRVVAAYTLVPVLGGADAKRGAPGLDSLLSTVQMLAASPWHPRHRQGGRDDAGLLASRFCPVRPDLRQTSCVSRRADSRSARNDSVTHVIGRALLSGCSGGDSGGW
jgi:phosphoribosylcarboxyaminoimidazole (NCAIR) mutase